MRKLRHWLREIFDPEDFNNLDISLIAGSFNDPAVRSIWLNDCLEELKRINLELDKRILSGDVEVFDLCVRRKAYQDILEGVLSARRQAGQGERPNPKVQGVNLDRVTA